MTKHEDPSTMSDREFSEFEARRTPVLFFPEIEDPTSSQIHGGFDVILFWLQYVDDEGHKKSIALEQEDQVFAEIHKSRIQSDTVAAVGDEEDLLFVYFKLVGADWWSGLLGPKHKIRNAFEFIGIPLT